MSAYCDHPSCGHRRATRSTEELPDAVKGDMGKVCDDCWRELLVLAVVLGYDDLAVGA